jgi:phosphoribosylformylglycinamidine (FGAM) synthase PurS component
LFEIDVKIGVNWARAESPIEDTAREVLANPIIEGLHVDLLD